MQAKVIIKKYYPYGIVAVALIAIIYFWKDLKILFSKITGGNVEDAQVAKVSRTAAFKKPITTSVIRGSGSIVSTTTGAPAAGQSLFSLTDGLQVWDQPSNGIDSRVVATFAKDNYIGTFNLIANPTNASQARGNWYSVSTTLLVLGKKISTRTVYVYADLVRT